MQCQRDKFSLPDDVRYLNHAYMSPMSKKVQSAGRDAIARLGNPARVSAADFFEPANELRRSFASLVGAPDWEQVAVVPSASYAMAIIASNLRLGGHQNVVVLGEQFPSNVYAWRRLCKERGATLRTVAPPQSGGRRGDEWNRSLMDAIDENTALVSIANVHWSDGTVFDIETVGRRCRMLGATFVIDGTQSVGALPINVSDVGMDALVCSGYKWLTGPYGLGLAYFGPKFTEAKPIEDNWIARYGSEDFAGLVKYVDDYQPGAKRFDMGEYSSFTLLPMLAAALDQVTEWSPAGIQAYCRQLTTTLAEAAAALGYQIEESAYRAGHLMGIRMPPGIDTGVVKRSLEEHGVFVSIRGQSVRVAPHLYSRDDDIDALVEVLGECLPR